LPPTVQQKMEAFFNTSFADVRVHVGPEAAAIGALAFTSGPNLYFAPGQYNPTISHGQKLLAHELAHVVQQRAGRVRNPFGSGTAVVQDPLLEAEAERLGHQAVIHRAPVQAKPSSVPLAVPGRRPAPATRMVQGQRGAAVQPFCGWLSNCFAWLCPPRRTPTFDDNYGAPQIRARIDRQRLLSDEETDWFSDTTCSTTAHRVSGALSTGGALGRGVDVRSLKRFMQGTGKDADMGVVIEVKIGQVGFSQHEFALEQMGEECFLIQAWLRQMTLEQGLGRTARRRVTDILDELTTLETTWLGNDSDRFRNALATTFGVNYSDTDWANEWQRNWQPGTRQLSWEAWTRR
jgi:hypothetical protein